MKNCTISFIGGGNMAASLIGGLIADGFAADRIWVADPNEQRLADLRERFLVHTTNDNERAARSAEVLVLAVKPQILRAVCQGIASTVSEHMPLVVSIAAGVRTQSISSWLNCAAPVIRAMPNTPALVGSGASALFADGAATATHKLLAESLMRSVGVAVWVEDEKLMDPVTALSGSGPAYFFLVMEAMEAAAKALGLPAETARLLTLQTAFGAAKMALESDVDLVTLRRNVTSPGGTTEAAINTLEQKDVAAIFATALTAATRRAQELADLFGGNT